MKPLVAARLERYQSVWWTNASRSGRKQFLSPIHLTFPPFLLLNGSLSYSDIGDGIHSHFWHKVSTNKLMQGMAQSITNAIVAHLCNRLL